VKRYMREGLEQLRPGGRLTAGFRSTIERWTAEEKLRVLVAAHGLVGEQLGALLRREGLHEEQLTQWRQSAVGALAPESSARPSGAQRRKVAEVQKRVKELERELRRKERDTRGVQPSALLPAPLSRMSCPLRWRSPWPELRLRHPAPFRAPGALVRSYWGALSCSDPPHQDPQGPSSKGGPGHASPSVLRTSALSLSLYDDPPKPKRASGTRPEACKPPARGEAALDGWGAVRRPRSF
jgi:hypothetical protein